MVKSSSQSLFYTQPFLYAKLGPMQVNVTQQPTYTEKLLLLSWVAHVLF